MSYRVLRVESWSLPLPSFSSTLDLLFPGLEDVSMDGLSWSLLSIRLPWRWRCFHPWLRRMRVPEQQSTRFCRQLGRGVRKCPKGYEGLSLQLFRYLGPSWISTFKHQEAYCETQASYWSRLPWLVLLSSGWPCPGLPQRWPAWPRHFKLFFSFPLPTGIVQRTSAWCFVGWSRWPVFFCSGWL